MIAPDITFRQIASPWAVLGSLPYIQSAPSGDVLPVNQGEESNALLFRIYNNFALNAGIATATNVKITVYDGAGSGSHTCAVTPVSQSWIMMNEYGYGENSSDSPDLFTGFLGTALAIGGCNPCGGNYYAPEKGSDGSTNAQIRAYSSGNGMGYIECQTYAKLPPIGVVNADYAFAISVSYDWTP